MASNNISKYYKVDGGLDLTSDSQFATLSANEKIVYKPSGEKYIKNSNYSNVFDKTISVDVSDLESKVNTKTVAKITDADANGSASYYNVAGNKIGEFKCGLPIIGSDGNTNVTAVSQNGNVLTVEVPRVYYDKYGRVTKWDKQTATAIVSGGSSSGVGYTGVPVGTISMWAGSVSDIPAGWHLCDGTNGTPDLRDKFVVGAGNKYNPGAQGEFNTVGEGTRTWGSGDLSYSGNGDVMLRSIENPTNGTLTYTGVMIGAGRSMRLNFPIPFSSFTVPVINAVIGHGSDGDAISRPYVLVDDIQNGYIVFTNPDNDSAWQVRFNITGTVDPSLLVSNADNDYNYYALCYIMKVQTDGSPTVVTNNNPTLNFGQSNITIGVIDNKALTVNMPSYSAGTGLSLEGTTFSLSQELLDKINNIGSGGIGGDDYFEYVTGTGPGAMGYATFSNGNESIYPKDLDTDSVYKYFIQDHADTPPFKVGAIMGDDNVVYPYKNVITGDVGTPFNVIAHVFYWYLSRVGNGGNEAGGPRIIWKLFTICFGKQQSGTGYGQIEVTSNKWIDNYVNNIIPTLPTGLQDNHGYKIVKGYNS